MNEKSHSLPTKENSVELEKVISIEETNPSTPLVFKISPALKKEDGLNTEETQEVIAVGGGFNLVELLLVLSICAAMATAAFVVFPQVQSSQQANEFTKHVAAWSNSPTLVSQDEYFNYQAMFHPDKSLQEVRVFSKDPKGYGVNLLGGVHRKFNRLETDLNKLNSTQAFQGIGVAPSSDCLIDVHLTQTSMTWEFKPGCKK